MVHLGSLLSTQEARVALGCRVASCDHATLTLLSCLETSRVHHLRNRKHVPCFYRVIQTRVEVWENGKCCGNTSRRRVFPQLFRVLPNFHECLYNSLETRSTCFVFLFYYIDTGVLLENIPLVKFMKTTSGTRVVYFP